jgi:CubicO group peptidase (beta-lactamase class C family)
MIRKYFHLAFALSVLLSLSVGSFTLGSTSSYQNDALTARVDKLFAQWDKPNSPGGMLAIIRYGKIIYERGYGSADLEHNVSISPETVFNIASTSKQFTAMSILLLARQGKISLDDDIRKYVPELPNYDSPITVRQLIHHTSGLRDYLGLMALAGVRQEDYYDQDDVMELMVRQKHLNFKPGSEFLYSNTGYVLLSLIVKKASGKSLREFADENIFQPLGMKHTHFQDDQTETIPNRAIGYSVGEGGTFRISERGNDIVGDGNLYTTVNDLLLWDQNFYDNRLNQEDKDLISQLITPGALNNHEKIQYAFGLYIANYKGLITASHSGTIPGYRSEMIRFPEQGFSIICLANVSNLNSGKLASQVADIYLADKFKPDDEQNRLPAVTASQFIKLSEQELSAYTGSYLDPLTNDFWQVSSAEGILVAATTKGNFKFAPLGKNHFRSTNLNPIRELLFESSANKPTLMRVNTDGRQPIEFEAVTPALPTLAQFSEYVGDYYNDELQVTYKVTLEKDRLYLRKGYGRIGNNFRSRDELVPTIKDHFNGGSISIHFVRDRQNRVAEFTLSVGRVKDLQYLRKAT